METTPSKLNVTFSALIWVRFWGSFKENYMKISAVSGSVSLALVRVSSVDSITAFGSRGARFEFSRHPFFLR